MKGRFSDRRALTRRHLLFYLDVIDRASGASLGRLGDISREGILVIAPTALEIDRSYQVRIILPTTIRDFSKPAIEAEVVACWTSPDANPELQCSGCRFLGISEDDRALVVHLIHILGFQE